MKHTLCSLACLVLMSGTIMLELPRSVRAEETGKSNNIKFEKRQLDEVFRSEGVAVGDFNHDGKQDIAAGYVWYEAPDWKMHAIIEKAPEYQPKGYSNSFCTFAEDINGDGWLDIVVVDFPGTPTWWFENPHNAKGPWKKHTATPVTNNESPQMLDVDGDGKRELIAAFSADPKQPDGPTRQMAYMQYGDDATKVWTIHALSEQEAPGTKKYSHGLGVGDVNGDGRRDFLCAEGWWEAPESSAKQPWTFHAAPFGGLAAQMHVYDYDGDGDADVLSSSPHAFGIWWHEQVAPNKWKTHEIDNSFSQTHGLCLADINGDGLPDFVTGKRWWAHGGRDPGGDQPAVMVWFELSRENGRPVWTPHQFDHNSGVGTQFEVADVDGDGLLDVVTSNKRGVFYFRQVRE